MVTALDRLKKGLGHSIRRLEGYSPDPGEEGALKRLRLINRELERRIDDTSSEASPDRTYDALRRFRECWEFGNGRDARLVCSQIHLPVLSAEGDRLRPIEDQEWFARITGSVDRLKPQPRQFRRCYRGLLTGYLECDPDDQTLRETGRRNWAQLRGFLQERVDWLHVNAFDPAWVKVLDAHRNLLGEDPCARYARDVLAGQSAEWETVRETFGLSGGTWLTRRLIDAQISAAVESPDAEFVGVIPAILALLARPEYSSLFDKGLARLLDRYRTVRPPSIHAPLRDTSTTRWRSPILLANRGNWSRVQDATREMVADWIKLEAIQRFFEYLAEEGGTDKRRVRYWERRHRQIEQFWLVLGDAAASNPDPGFRKLRDRMRQDGLLKGLSGGGGNNAIVMRMGELLVVEFSKTGNACYIYDQRRGIPFDLERQSFSTYELKRNQRVEWLRHGNDWESDFDRALERWGIPRPYGAMAAQPTHHAIIREEAPTARRRPDPFSEDGFKSFVDRHGFEWSDRRRLGGVLRVIAPALTEEAEAQLRTWRFKRMRSGDWWRE